MTAGSSAKLYSAEMLSLATELARYPIGGGDWRRDVEVRSRTCGSSLRFTVNLNAAESVDAFGLAVSACAVGQAAAAIFARSANGLCCEDAAKAFKQIETWLKEASAPLPDWPDISALTSAREHSARHGAILLPWNAAMQALCKESVTR